MSDQVALEVVPSMLLPAAARVEVVRLCTRAYEEDFASMFQAFPDAVHILARAEGVLASHALWVTRWLQVGDALPLRTAYVEAVATDPAYRRRGYATAVMRGVADAIGDFDLAALSPSDIGFYSRLGWEHWQGPLSIRTAAGRLLTPNETVMILRLPNTPPLDLYAPLSVEWREGELW